MSLILFPKQNQRNLKQRTNKQNSWDKNCVTSVNFQFFSLFYLVPSFFFLFFLNTKHNLQANPCTVVFESGILYPAWGWHSCPCMLRLTVLFKNLSPSHTVTFCQCCSKICLLCVLFKSQSHSHTIIFFQCCSKAQSPLCTVIFCQWCSKLQSVTSSAVRPKGL